VASVVVAGATPTGLILCNPSLSSNSSTFGTTSGSGDATTLNWKIVDGPIRVLGNFIFVSPGGELSEGPSPSHDSGDSLDEESVLTLARWWSESPIIV
jgi:hypothetical protein